RALPLAVGAQLLAQRRHAFFQHRLLAQDALQLVRHADAKVLDPHRLVAAQALAKLLLPHVERREMERAFAHSALPSRVARSASGAPAVALGPNRTVPKRIAVAPSSTAIP